MREEDVGRDEVLVSYRAVQGRHSQGGGLGIDVVVYVGVQLEEVVVNYGRDAEHGGED